MASGRRPGLESVGDCLVRAGHVFVAMPPLYRIDVGKKVFYALDEPERQGVLDRIKAEKIKGQINVQRFKGLGEMPAKELWDTTMDPTHRILTQITLEDAAAADDLFSVLMGEDVELRRNFIQRNAKDVRFLDI